MEALLEQFESMKTEIVQSRQEVLGTIDMVINEVEAARNQVRTAKLGLTEDNKEEAKLKIVSSTNALSKKLETMKPLQKVVDTNVEYYKHITKFGKVVPKYLNPDIEAASYKAKFPLGVINRVFLLYGLANT